MNDALLKALKYAKKQSKVFYVWATYAVIAIRDNKKQMTYSQGHYEVHPDGSIIRKDYDFMAQTWSSTQLKYTIS